MSNEEFVATLRSMKVPAGLAHSKAFVDHMIETAERNEPTQTPQEAIAAITQHMSLLEASHLDLIAAIGDIEEKLATITDVVNQHTEAVKQIAARLG